MLNGYMLAKEAAAYLSERAGREITIDDLRQMRRHRHVEGIKLGYNVIVFTKAQLDSATIPPERKSPTRRNRKKRRKATKS